MYKMGKLTNKEIDLLKHALVFLAAIIGVIYLYTLTLPKVETTPLSIFSFIGICLGISFILHGFHPILLSKKGDLVSVDIGNKE